MKTKTFLATIILFVMIGSQSLAESVILPHRVIDARTRTVIDFEGLIARCSEAQVVTLGENHDDPATHLIELAVLEGIYRRHENVILSMEMFERDVQKILNSYLAWEIGEEEFLAGSRPWGNYGSDYRPLIELARKNEIPVIASNVPRHLAAFIASEGIEDADFTEEEQQFIAETFEAPHDSYWDNFAATMRMPGMVEMGVTEENIRLYYQAQVLKDETMAESVSLAANENPESVVYHIAGAFHLANYLGTFSRIKRNLTNCDCVSIIVVPVDDLLAPPPDDIPKADYWILVEAPEKEDVPEMPEMPVMMQSEDRPESEVE